MPFFDYLTEEAGVTDIALAEPEKFIHLGAFTQRCYAGRRRSVKPNANSLLPMFRGSTIANTATASTEPPPRILASIPRSSKIS